MPTLDALLQRLREADLLLRQQGRFDSRPLDHLAHDSRKARPGGVFVAIQGGQADGHAFLDKAVKYGAIALVCEAMPADADTRFPGIALAHVANTRAALAHAAALFYDDPARHLQMVGVTGTNGKTTTTYLLHHLFSSLGLRPGLVGTIETRIGTDAVPSALTTPDALDLQRLLRQMVDAGCDACAMEVSSHALDQDRVAAVPFRIAAFTNFTRDHLDYHETADAYFAAKKKLFDGLAPDATAVTNADDPAGPAIVADTPARVLTYGATPDADISVAVVENRLTGLRLRLDGVERRFRLVGRFNAYNLAAAYGVGRALGYEQAAVLDALADAPPVPGRFEQIRFPDGRTVIVDYAHTPDALENVLQTVRDTKDAGATLWCVFGCGGDRDRSKRRLMGAIAERYADAVIVTSDNPRTEDPEAIMNDIRRGMDHPAEAAWIADRRDAIRHAAAVSRPGDVVLIAGKGHETYQDAGGQKRPFDDREEARANFE